MRSRHREPVAVVHGTYRELPPVITGYEVEFSDGRFGTYHTAVIDPVNAVLTVRAKGTADSPCIRISPHHWTEVHEITKD